MFFDIGPYSYKRVFCIESEQKQIIANSLMLITRHTNQTGSDAWSSDDVRWSQWMSDAQRGDKVAYERLLIEIQSIIKRFLTARFGTAEFIDDITQECLLRIHKGRHTYDAKRPFRAWMFAIVRHSAIDFLRGWRSERPHGKTHREAQREPSTPAGANSALVDASLILSQLSRDHRNVIVLTKYLGYSAREASAELGISVAAVRVRLHRAIAQTQTLLSAEDHSKS